MSKPDPMLRTLQLAQKLGAIQRIPFQRQNLNKGKEWFIFNGFQKKPTRDAKLL